MLLLLLQGEVISVAGALVADSADVSVDVGPVVTVTGTLQAATSVLEGEASAGFSASGSLEAGTSSLSGDATAPEVRALVSWAEIELVVEEESSAGAGDLLAGAANIDGAARAIISVAGSLQTAPAEIVSEARATVAVSGNLAAIAAVIAADLELALSISGSLVAAPSTIEAEATAFWSAAGDLQAQSSVIDGSTQLTAITFAGLLQSGSAQISGVASWRRKISTAVAPRRHYARRSNVQSQWTRRTG